MLDLPHTSTLLLLHLIGFTYWNNEFAFQYTLTAFTPVLLAGEKQGGEEKWSQKFSLAAMFILLLPVLKEAENIMSP